MTCADCGVLVERVQHGIRLVSRDCKGKEFALCPRCFLRRPDDSRAVRR
jgi:hypothetical protein